ncbi:MAG: hypothetical protein ACT4O2_09535 [Beijerinckiaceae bacterium]
MPSTKRPQGFASAALPTTLFAVYHGADHNDADVTQRAAGFLSQWFAGGLVSRLAISG